MGGNRSRLLSQPSTHRRWDGRSLAAIPKSLNVWTTRLGGSWLDGLDVGKLASQGWISFHVGERFQVPCPGGSV